MSPLRALSVLALTTGIASALLYRVASSLGLQRAANACCVLLVVCVIGFFVAWGAAADGECRAAGGSPQHGPRSFTCVGAD